jgi:hypothetical protein
VAVEYRHHALDAVLARLHVAADYQADGFEACCHFRMITDIPLI